MTNSTGDDGTAYRFPTSAFLVQQYPPMLFQFVTQAFSCQLWQTWFDGKLEYCFLQFSTALEFLQLSLNVDPFRCLDLCTHNIVCVSLYVCVYVCIWSDTHHFGIRCISRNGVQRRFHLVNSFNRWLSWTTNATICSIPLFVNVVVYCWRLYNVNPWEASEATVWCYTYIYSVD